MIYENIRRFLSAHRYALKNYETVTDQAIEIGELEAELDNTIARLRLAKDTIACYEGMVGNMAEAGILVAAAADYSKNALKRVIDEGNAVNSANGTTRKLVRIASEAYANVETPEKFKDHLRSEVEKAFEVSFREPVEAPFEEPVVTGTIKASEIYPSSIAAEPIKVSTVTATKLETGVITPWENPVIPTPVDTGSALTDSYNAVKTETAPTETLFNGGDTGGAGASSSWDAGSSNTYNSDSSSSYTSSSDSSSSYDSGSSSSGSYD